MKLEEVFTVAVDGMEFELEFHHVVVSQQTRNGEVVDVYSVEDAESYIAVDFWAAEIEDQPDFSCDIRTSGSILKGVNLEQLHEMIVTLLEYFETRGDR